MPNSITNKFTNNRGQEFTFEYQQADSFDHLPKDEITQCYAVAFYNDKIVLVHNTVDEMWTLIGGTVEEGENLGNTLIREIQEESNMKTISYKPIGYQKATTEGSKPHYQLRYLAIVEPYGPFESDPDGAIDKIELVDPKNYKEYFDWGDVGDNIMRRALELLNDT